MADLTKATLNPAQLKTFNSAREGFKEKVLKKITAELIKKLGDKVTPEMVQKLYDDAVKIPPTNPIVTKYNEKYNQVTQDGVTVLVPNEDGMDDWAMVAVNTENQALHPQGMDWIKNMFNFVMALFTNGFNWKAANASAAIDSTTEKFNTNVNKMGEEHGEFIAQSTIGEDGSKTTVREQGIALINKAINVQYGVERADRPFNLADEIKRQKEEARVKPGSVPAGPAASGPAATAPALTGNLNARVTQAVKIVSDELINSMADAEGKNAATALKDVMSQTATKVLEPILKDKTALSENDLKKAADEYAAQLFAAVTDAPGKANLRKMIEKAALKLGVTIQPTATEEDLKGYLAMGMFKQFKEKSNLLLAAATGVNPAPAPAVPGGPAPTLTGTTVDQRVGQAVEIISSALVKGLPSDELKKEGEALKPEMLKIAKQVILANQTTLKGKTTLEPNDVQDLATQYADELFKNEDLKKQLVALVKKQVPDADEAKAKSLLISQMLVPTFQGNASLLIASVKGKEVTPAEKDKDRQAQLEIAERNSQNIEEEMKGTISGKVYNGYINAVTDGMMETWSKQYTNIGFAGFTKPVYEELGIIRRYKKDPPKNQAQSIQLIKARQKVYDRAVSDGYALNPDQLGAVSLSISDTFNEIMKKPENQGLSAEELATAVQIAVYNKITNDPELRKTIDERGLSLAAISESVKAKTGKDFVFTIAEEIGNKVRTNEDGMYDKLAAAQKGLAAARAQILVASGSVPTGPTSVRSVVMPAGGPTGPTTVAAPRPVEPTAPSPGT